jgi:hypothetical protein
MKYILFNIIRSCSYTAFAYAAFALTANLGSLIDLFYLNLVFLPFFNTYLNDIKCQLNCSVGQTIVQNMFYKCPKKCS